MTGLHFELKPLTTFIKNKQEILTRYMPIWKIDKAVKSPIKSQHKTFIMIWAFWLEVIDFLITFTAK